MNFRQHWALLKQSLGFDPESEIVSINPNVQVVIPREFLEEAHQNEAQLRDIEKALTKKVEECNKIRERWQAVVGELSDLKSSKQVFMVDDAEMTAKWKRLQYSIKNFARTHLWNLSSPEQLTPEQVQLLGSVSPLYQDFLSAEGQVHLLFQAFIWFYITDSILHNPTMVWGKHISAALGGLFNMCHHNRDYYTWRAQTGEIMQKERGIDDKTKEALNRKLCRMIEQFIPTEMILDEKRKKAIRRSLEGIIDKAIELAVVFNQSRCVYSCASISVEGGFDPEIMEHNDESDALQPDLMISPILVKYGDSRGQNYDQHLILAKAYVCCLTRYTQKKGGQNSNNDENDEGGKGYPATECSVKV
ncbi:hypothetical protein O1611_g1154 [Lasiodiplodia mahajangana]|uniref:Uncharacterized protein n=1 Tax=Lasiodiplodia mahajangana TaxID=1108764 RepID=A0ACC2JYZ2_9PEZI|nr:hypothetical protein O1611_g1154 [Lasiodiplodia mahajangana]